MRSVASTPVSTPAAGLPVTEGDDPLATGTEQDQPPVGRNPRSAPGNHQPLQRTHPSPADAGSRTTLIDPDEPSEGVRVVPE